jgi:hypothetical protein
MAEPIIDILNNALIIGLFKLTSLSNIFLALIIPFNFVTGVGVRLVGLLFLLIFLADIELFKRVFK